MLVGVYHCFIVFIEHPIEPEFSEEFVTLALISRRFQVECHSTFHWLVVQVVEQLVLMFLVLEVVLLPVVRCRLLRGRWLLLLLLLNVSHEYWYYLRCWGC